MILIKKEYPHFILEISEFEDKSRGQLKEAIKIKYELKDKNGAEKWDGWLNDKKNILQDFLRSKYGQDVHGEWKISKVMKKKLPNLLKLKDKMDERENLSYFLYFEKEISKEEIIKNINDVLTEELYN